jgi:hypothetical protein
VLRVAVTLQRVAPSTDAELVGCRVIERRLGGRQCVLHVELVELGHHECHLRRRIVEGRLGRGSLFARIRVRVGDAIEPTGRPNRDGVDALTARCHAALAILVGEQPELERPGPFGRWLTEVFNEWPEGSREAAESAERARIAATVPSPTSPGRPQARPAEV